MILKVALPTPLRRLFDYLPNDDIAACQNIQPGVRVQVPFGRRTLVGIVMNITQKSDIELAKLKPIAALLDEKPLFPKDLLNFFNKAAQYYHHPIGEVVFSGLPQALKQDKKLKPPKAIANATSQTSPYQFSPEQDTAITAVLEKQNIFSAYLLHGITGSGKTEVYLEITRQLLLANKQILILVPEISLTPQTLKRFEERFGGQVAGYHSQLTPAKRRDVFLHVQQQNIKVIVGTRSALFLPFTNLGLIVVDEEHDPSFKQQEGFRYSARDLAVLRAMLLNLPVILGSATPSFESLHNAKLGKYKLLVLPTRATNVALPKIELIDVRHKKLNSGLSAALLDQIKKTLKTKGQVLLFINRRGFAPVYMCFDCGWFAGCPNCESKLTYHLSKNKLICHHCERVMFLPPQCPQCKSDELNALGQGTEKIEEALCQAFPEYTIARIDSDTTHKKGSLDNLLSQAHNHDAQILIGTQILAKGHHFPHLALVAIIDADGGLFSADFRAQERMAQLLIQVSGRAGRVHHAGKVFIQTFHPEHPFMNQICAQNYSQLASELLSQRQTAHLPPFSHLALIRANHTQMDLPETFLMQTQQDLKKQYAGSTIQIKGPVPSPFHKRQGRYHYQLLLQADDRKSLHKAISYSAFLLESSKLGKKLRWSLDVDPIDMV